MTLDLNALFFADIVWRTALVLVVGLAIAKLIRKRPAALRYDVAVVTMVAALAVPILYTVIPKVAIIPTVPVVSDLSADSMTHERVAQNQALAWEESEAVQSGSPLDDQARKATPGAVSNNRMVEALGSVLAEVRNLTVWQLAFLVWAFGFVGTLVHGAIGRLRLVRIWNASRSVSHPEWDHVLEEAGDRVFLTRNVDARELEGIQSPMTWGIVAPKLLIPSSLHEWTHERKLNAVMHELVHIRRRDAIHDAVSSVVLAINWFNPFAWMMRSEVKAAREASCDAEVLGLGAQPEEYAHMLIDVAKGMRSSGRSMNFAMTMARPTQLEGRVLSVLNYAPRSISPFSRHMTIAAMALVVLFSSAATMQSQPSDLALEGSEGAVKGTVEGGVEGVDGLTQAETSGQPEDWQPAGMDDSDANSQSERDAASERTATMQREARSDRNQIPVGLDPPSDADAQAVLPSWPEEDVNPLGDLFAVAGIQLADAVLQEIGQSLDDFDWDAILDDAEWDIQIDEPEGGDTAEGKRSWGSSSDTDLDGAVGRLSERLQSAIIIELEKTILENPGTDKSRRARKALIAIDSDASRQALKRLGIVALPR